MIKRLFLISILLVSSGAFAQDYSQLVFSAAPDHFDGRLDVEYGEQFQLYALMLGTESFEPYPYGFQQVTWAVLAGC
ncbi:hypothetical protein HN843_05930 [bacterium]|mgnify:CR=1 FL=1|jgi:hypothetical protein|nr:hypothetical protein [bacterium]